MKKSNLFTALCCLFFPFLLSAQTTPPWNWLKVVGGSGPDAANDVKYDASGNVYMTGTFTGKITIGTAQWDSEGLSNGFIAKFTSNGGFLWARQFKSSSQDGEVSGRNIVIDGNGDIIVSGIFKAGNLDTGSSTLALSGMADLFFAKFNPDGDQLWVGSYGLLNIALSSRRMTVDDAGNVYILGNPRMIRVSASGTLDWAVLNPGLSDLSGDIYWNNDKLYLSGTFSTQITLGTETIFTTRAAVFFCEVSPDSGTLSNATKLLEDTNAFGAISLHAMIVSNNNTVYLAGRFRGNLIAGTCYAESMTAVNAIDKGFVAKVTINTSCVWLSADQSTDANYSMVNSISLDQNGHVWAVGQRMPESGLDFNGLTLNDNDTGFLLELDEATGTAIALSSRATLNSIACDGTGCFSGGFDLYTATLAKSGAAGTVLFHQAFENDGGYCQITALETGSTGIYLAANVRGKIKLGNNVIDASSNALLLAKTSFSGNQIYWYKIIEGLSNVSRLEGANAGVLDKNSGKFYCSVFYTDTVIYNAQSYIPTALHTSEYAVLQTGTDGSDGWLKAYPNVDYINHITLDHLGNVLVSGGLEAEITLGNTTLTSKGDFDFFLAKMNGNGDFLWVKRGGGADVEYGSMVSTDAQNNIYLAAECYSTQLDFDDTWSLSNQEGDGNFLFLKLSPDGAVQWSKLYGADGGTGAEFSCFPYTIITDPAGNSYISGFYGVQNNFGNLDLSSPYTFNNFIGKFDPNGDPIWITPIKTRRLASAYSEIGLDEQGNVYLSNQIRDSTFIGSVILVKQGLISARNIYYARFDGQSGTLDWVKTISGSPEAVGTPFALSVYDHESLLVGGSVQGRMQFDNFEAKTGSSLTGYFGLLGASVTVSVKNPTQGVAVLELSPNPAGASTHISSSEVLSGPVKITLLNSRGEQMLEENLASFSAGHQIDLSQLPAGVYFVRVSFGKTTETKRLVIHK